MIPLRVRAELVNGFVAKDAWSPALDGILAAGMLEEKMGAEAYAISAASPRTWAPVEGLPLAVEQDDALWWYHTSSPCPIAVHGQERRAYHRRFDDQHQRYLTLNIKRVATSAGPYKGTRLQDTRTLCRAIEWRAVGDAAEVLRLLQRVSQVGGRRGIGYGEVISWHVEAGDAADAEAARLYRPLPLDYARRNGCAGPVLLRGLVPPTRHNPVECIMPMERIRNA